MIREPDLPQMNCDWRQWDNIIPQPTAEQIENRLADLGKAIDGYHELGMDAPLQWYDEFESRNRQLFTMGKK